MIASISWGACAKPSPPVLVPEPSSTSQEPSLIEVGADVSASRLHAELRAFSASRGLRGDCALIFGPDAAPSSEAPRIRLVPPRGEPALEAAVVCGDAMFTSTAVALQDGVVVSLQPDGFWASHPSDTSARRRLDQTAEPLRTIAVFTPDDESGPSTRGAEIVMALRDRLFHMVSYIAWEIGTVPEPSLAPAPISH
ncbi:MAG: hypothetical protein H0T89_15630 [Deltaproteobacteria bacterium]|nr:hypothetical protein [Deltaproteobacteria bacterium]MDQ3300009.1 hypothetical protein [Myxococcota bacterium]